MTRKKRMTQREVDELWLAYGFHLDSIKDGRTKKSIPIVFIREKSIWF